VSGVALTMMAFALPAVPASAVTIGQVPAVAQDACDVEPIDLVQPTVTSGTSYVVPSSGGIAAWTVTSWSTRTSPFPGQSMALKMFRKVSDPVTYQVVGHDGPRALAPGLNSFPAHVVVKPGDVLGLNYVSGGSCAFQAPGEPILYNPGSLADGGSAAFTPDTDFRVNESAELTPTSDISFGKVKSNPNGTATLPVNVPNPGQLKAKGNGVNASSAGAVSATKVKSPGRVKLRIRARGKSARKLADTGKVTLKAKIVFTPTGGIASTTKKKIKLHRA